MAHLGIDLGTSNTLVAHVNRSGEPVIMEIEGAPMIPSVICFEEEDGSPAVGKLAEQLWGESQSDNGRCFRRWKLLMGEGSILGELSSGSGQGSRLSVTPEYLTTRLVEYVCNELSAGVGGETIDSVLVTVPHGWRRERPEKCRATRLAAAQAKVGGRPVEVKRLTVSEPVAAAAYWIWEARRTRAAVDLTGRALLVCDIGGGTFDLSLVHVGSSARPLDVVNAANTEYAGDYVDGLLVAWMCRAFNRQLGTKYPDTAEQVLDGLTQPDAVWLRKWFTMARNIKLKASLAMKARSGREGSARKPISESITDEVGRSLQLSFDVEAFRECLAPFYEQGRQFLRSFLRKLPAERLPYALVFAGGGSRILGVREEIVQPVLAEFYTPAEADAVLSRIPVNSIKLDHSIALGAALIANDIVSVQERLLNDIGLVGGIDGNLARQLGLAAKPQQILVTPVIERLRPLPAVVTNKEIGIVTKLAQGDSLILNVMVDEGAGQDPWIQSWELPHPTGGKEQTMDWSIEADVDGVLTVSLVPQQGQTVQVMGKLEQARTGRASLMFGAQSPVAQGTLPRVTPQALAQAIRGITAAAK